MPSPSSIGHRLIHDLLRLGDDDVARPGRVLPQASSVACSELAMTSILPSLLKSATETGIAASEAAVDIVGGEFDRAGGSSASKSRFTRDDRARHGCIARVFGSHCAIIVQVEPNYVKDYWCPGGPPGCQCSVVLRKGQTPFQKVGKRGLTLSPV